MMMLPDGLYRVDFNNVCAGFVIAGGKLKQCAPILRKKFSWWATKATKVN